MPWKKDGQLPFAIVASLLCWGSFALAVWSANKTIKDSKKPEDDKMISGFFACFMAFMAIIVTVGTLGEAYINSNNTVVNISK